MVFTAPPNDTIGTITQPVPLTGAGVAVLLEGEQGLPLTVAGDWTMVVNAVTPTGVFTSPPQGFTILNADGTEAVTELTVPPAVNVTIPPPPARPDPRLMRPLPARRQRRRTNSSNDTGSATSSWS